MSLYLTSEEKKKPTSGDMMYLLHILAIIKKNGFDKDIINQFIDLHLQNSPSENPLKVLQSAMRLLYDGVSSEITERLMKQGGVEAGDRLPDMSQPKYKTSVIADLTGYSRQAVNNWTKNKGGYLRSFEFEGSAKFILEEDLLAKLKELGNQHGIRGIDDEFRQKHEYKVNVLNTKNRR